MSSRREFIKFTAATSVVAAAAFQPGQANRAFGSSPRLLKTCRIPQTELEVSRIAYGTALADIKQDFGATLERALRTACDNGITFIDLADVYGNGEAELTLGEMLKGSRGLRDKIVIQSKCGVRFYKDTWGHDASHDHIVRATEASLQRLGTDRLDILLLHAPDFWMQPAEVARAFDELHQSGKVRHFGVSNHKILQIELLNKYLNQPLVVNQIGLGLAHYSAMSGSGSYHGGIVDFCRLHNMQVQAWSPLRGGGLLKPPADASEQLKKVAGLLATLAKQKETNPSAVALAWLLHHPAGIVPIIGSEKPQYIVENCAADRVTLSREEWYGLFWAASNIQPKPAV